MKKIIGMFLALMVITVTFAQESEETNTNTESEGGNNPQIQNKKGKDFMPVKGEFAIGINGASLLRNVLGQFGTSNNSATNSYFVDGGVYGKYFLTNSSAIRVGFNFNSSYSSDRIRVADDNAQNPDSVAFDETRGAFNNYNISIGYEKRRGKGRFRAVYGANVDFNLFYNRTEYKYANEMSASNTKPSTYTAGVYQNGNERLLRSESTGNITIALRGFIGIEYFIAPKVAIGTEFGLGVSKFWARDRVSTYEYWNTTDNILETKDDLENKNFGNRSFNISTDNFNNALYLMIFF